MPARHASLSTVCFPNGSKFEDRLLSTKEGVGETSGQTAGSFWGSMLPLKVDPAEETGFLRSVRIASGSQFHRSDGLVARGSIVKSGPDVFADALVPNPVRASPALFSPERVLLFRRCIRLSIRGRHLPPLGLARCGNGYRLAKRHGKPIS
jgi:hypothetical protein